MNMLVQNQLEHIRFATWWKLISRLIRVNIDEKQYERMIAVTLVVLMKTKAKTLDGVN